MSASGADVLVIGGGAAGMMAAGTAAERGARVVLLEHNARLGRKLYITGKGRCNLTNDCAVEEALANVPHNGRFLHSAFRAFPPSETMAFFAGIGCPVKTERGGRVFPVSDRSASVVDALCAWLRRSGVRVETGEAKRLLVREGRCAGAETDRGVLKAGAVVLATGGMSYPLTGSTGDGYRMAAEAGHTVTPLRPSLVPLCAEGCAPLAGLTLRNVGLRVLDGNGKTVYGDFGELAFTPTGLSGPTVLSASVHLAPETAYTAVIDLKPALDEKKLDLRLLRDFERYHDRPFRDALVDLLPRELIGEVVRRSQIPPAFPVHSITREQRRALLRALKRFEVPITGLGPFEEAIVTSGGVRTAEVDPGTMASKVLPGLYLAGELLDVDAYTGGFNLQIAWSTGRAAGLACAARARERKRGDGMRKTITDAGPAPD